MSGRKVLWLVLGGVLIAGGAIWFRVQGAAHAKAQPVARGAAGDAAPGPVKQLAVVNGEVITTTDLDLALKQAGPTPVALTEDQTKQMKLEIFRLLIDGALMRQFLTKFAPPASDADIARKMGELEEGLKKQGKSVTDHLRETHQAEAMLRTNIAFATQWENYAQAHVTDADLQRYYTENRDFFDGVTVRASHIVLRVPPSAPQDEISAARAKLLAVRAELIEKKGDFALAAKAQSQCPSKENGGDIGYITRKWSMVDEGFARAAFALSPGQISDVVQTDYGLHLIKVTDRKAGQQSDYTKIKEGVRQCYVEEMRQRLLQEERKKAKIQVELGNLQ